MTEDRNFLKKRSNWIEFVVDEISLVDVPAVAGAEIVALKRGVTNNGGDEQMDKIFIDGGHTVNRETLLLFIGEALKPLVQEIRDLNRRLDRLPNLTPRLPERDTFSDIVRGRKEFDEGRGREGGARRVPPPRPRSAHQYTSGASRRRFIKAGGSIARSRGALIHKGLACSGAGQAAGRRVVGPSGPARAVPIHRTQREPVTVAQRRRRRSLIRTDWNGRHEGRSRKVVATTGQANRPCYRCNRVISTDARKRDRCPFFHEGRSRPRSSPEDRQDRNPDRCRRFGEGYRRARPTAGWEAAGTWLTPAETRYNRNRDKCPCFGKGIARPRSGVADGQDASRRQEIPPARRSQGEERGRGGLTTPKSLHYQWNRRAGRDAWPREFSSRDEKVPFSARGPSRKSRTPWARAVHLRSG